MNERKVTSMQIQNQQLLRRYKVNEPQTPPKAGEVTSIVVKERKGNQEAVVQIKGSEQTVKFDGPIPKGDRALVEVVKNDKDGMVLRAVTAPGAKVPTVDDVMQKAGFSSSANKDLKNIATLLMNNGTPITKDVLNTINQFLKTDIGSIQQKTDTIKVLLQKNLEITPTHLHAVNEALNGEPLTDTLKDIVKNLDLPLHTQGKNEVASERPTNPVDMIKAQIKNEPDLVKAIEQLKAFAKDGQNVSDILDAKIKIATLLERIGRGDQARAQLLDAVNQIESEAIKQPIINQSEKASFNQAFIQDAKALIKSIQQEASLTTILGNMDDFLAKQPDTNGIDLEPLTVAYNKAMQLADQGRELAARRELSNALTQLEQKLGTNQNEAQLTDADQYAINEALQSLQLGSKNIEVTHISKRLSQMAIDFKKLKRDMMQSLDTASKMLETNQQQAKPNIKQMLETTIKMIDKTILKSDMMLYTDMTQEKTLLMASSRLGEAKNLLEKGHFAEANKIVKDVQHVIEKMTFKPSDVKIKHFVSEQSLDANLSTQLEQVMKSSTEPTGRNVFDMVRRLGLTHEQDVAQSLVAHEQFTSDKNIKAMLMQLKDGGVQMADQALTNLTGQQLLNKQDPSGMQNLFFQLPVLLNKQAENVKVYVNSRKSSEKIDWENCSLYFVLETKKLGQMGILLSAQNRNLTVTLKSSKDLLEEKVDSLTGVSKERLKEIGYNLSDIHVKAEPKNEEVIPTKQATVSPTFTEKGYDFTI